MLKNVLLKISTNFSDFGVNKNVLSELISRYVTIISRARKGSESIAHSAFGLMGYWLGGHEGERNNCFSKIQLVGQKYRDKTTLAS